jgi:hypothetical protein
VCHELTYESTQKSGSLFYELIERPLKIHDKAVVELKGHRSSGTKDRAIRRKDSAERALKIGFLRLPGAADILEPLLALEADWDFRGWRGDL